LFIAVGLFCLKRLREASTARGAVAAAGGFLFLYFTPFRIKRAVTLALSLPLFWYLESRRGRGSIGEGGQRRLRIFASSLGVTTLIAMGSAAFSQAPHFLFLARQGIMGDNPGAKWIGVAEYLENHTPVSAKVLALSTWDYFWRPKRLICDGSLKTRSGRSSPVGHPFSFYADYKKMLWAHEMSRLVGEELVQKWNTQDLKGVLRVFEQSGFPDYLVAPISKARWLPRKDPAWPYTLETTIRDFAIYRKVSHDA
jgi:hypothetical protein